MSAIPDTTSYGNECSSSCLAATGRDHALGEVAHGLGELFVVIGQHSGGQKIGHDSSSFVLHLLIRLAGGDPGQRLAHLDLVADGDEQFDHAVDRRGKRVFHLHRLDGDDDGAGVHASAVLHTNGDNRTRHRAGQLGVAAVFVVGPHRRFPHFLDHRGAPAAGQPDLTVGLRRPGTRCATRPA